RAPPLVTLFPYTTLVRSPGEKIVLFFDGSKSGDHTGLVGCCIEDGYVFLGGVWEPQKIGKDLWRVDREAVDIRVSELVDEFKVLGIWGDPSDARDDETGERYWEPYFDMWHKRWGRKSGCGRRGRGIICIRGIGICVLRS